MIIEPVENAPKPEYPDKYSDTAKRIVLTARPRRWTGAPLAAGVLAAALTLGLSGCGRATAGSPAIMPDPTGLETGAVPSPGIMDGYTLGEPMMTSLGSIPLFLFGEGTGTIGCVSVTAPVFLSEDEAFAILSAAFEEAGLRLDREAYTIEQVVLPVTDKYAFASDDGDAPGTKTGALTPDGLLDVASGLPVAFVSSGDIDAWQRDTDYMVTVEEYGILGAAQTLAGENSDLAVFYDPAVSFEFDWGERGEGESDEAYGERINATIAEAKEAAREESERLLREQVAAFLKWLGDEGII